MKKKFALKIWMNVANEDVIREDLAWNLGVIADQIRDYGKVAGETEDFTWVLSGSIDKEKKL